jgi:hypothetical protein
MTRKIKLTKQYKPMGFGDLCLMHGGSPTNFELRNVPVENLIWLD